MDGQGSSCALAVALAAILSVFFLLIFMVGVAGGFVGKSGGGAGDLGTGTFSGNCDFDKILSDAATGEVHGKQLADGAPQKVPAKFIPVYEMAAKKKKLGGCGPAILAGIHSIETGFADTGYAVVNSAGAGGPFQFLSDSWDSFGEDCNGNGKVDAWPAYSVEDGACAAANHLRGPGKAPANWYAGIHSYNRADWYVYGVALQAQRFSKAAGGDQ